VTRRSRVRAALPFLSLLLLPTTAAAQHGHDHGERHDAREARRVSGALGAQAIGLATHATPHLDGRSLTEGYLTQPVVMGHLAVARDRLRLEGMLNLEPLTLRRGELNAGIWGEGYVDRRHPHTLLHEAVATVRVAGGGTARDEATLTLGKGFAPFGTDDPMARPFVKFPVNHHLAQVLERTVAIAAVRRGAVTLEGGLFNGDEPDGPWHLATPGRFGDSWAARATLRPLAGVEASGSYARVESPESPPEAGLHHRKASAALRWERQAAGGRAAYALLEWAHTDEYVGAQRSFGFGSVLAEGSVRHRRVEVAARWERTVRPEEERLLDPFRTPRPHGDVHILGRTRWTIGTLHLASTREARVARLGARPFVEVARLAATAVARPAVFIPAEFYGSDRMWSLSAGVRLQAGAAHGRMGRYGAARSVSHHHPHP
jgi:hypothetical protein